MNSKQLVRNLLTKQPTDRMGFSDNLWSKTYQKWKAQGYMQKRNELTGEMEDVSFQDWFNTDMYESWVIKPEPILGFREIIETNDKWTIAKDGYGAVFKRWNDQTGTPEHIDFEMSDMSVWELKYKPHVTNFNPNRINLAHTQDFIKNNEKNQKFAVYGSLCIWELLRLSLGDIQLFMSLLDDPEWIMDFNRTYTDFFKTYYTYVFEKCGLPDGIWFYDDLAYNKGPFCSPDILQEFFVPFYKELADFVHSYNIPVIFHSCGNVESVLPLVVESGFDALNPMEVKAGCDVVRFAEKYGDKLAFFGGFDVRILENGDKAAIKKEVIRICDTMRKLNVRYLFGTDHSITPNVEYESYQYALDVFKDNCYYE